MSEQNQDPAEHGRLTPEQEAAYRADLKIMLDPGSIAAADPGEAETIKADALAELAHGLADETTGQGLSDVIAEDYEAAQRDSIVNLYAYWLIAKTATQEHPDAELPAGFISHVRELAERHGEDDIAGQLGAVNSEETTETEDLSPEDLLSEQALLAVQKLERKRKETTARLFDFSSEAHLQDRTLLEENAGLPGHLLDHIKEGTFLTKEGVVAARVAQDLERLGDNAGLPGHMLDDIDEEKFLTDEGTSAAHVVQDQERLRDNAGLPGHMLDDINAGKFLTEAGVKAAMVVQDRERLADNAGLPGHMQDDLEAGKFLTPEGEAEARRVLAEASEHA